MVVSYKKIPRVTVADCKLSALGSNFLAVKFNPHDFFSCDYGRIVLIPITPVKGEGVASYYKGVIVQEDGQEYIVHFPELNPLGDDEVEVILNAAGNDVLVGGSCYPEIK